MKWYFLLTLLMLLSACTAPQSAPRFNAPSTKAIQTGIKNARTHVQQAKKQAQDIAKTVESDCPQVKLQVQELQTTLDSALSDLDTSEGSRTQLETQLKEQADKANELARNYDHAAVQITTLKESRHRWVKLFLGSSALLLAALVWIFRKPLLLVAGGI